MKDREGHAWDRQIEEDVESGRLDALYVSLMEEGGDQSKVPLNEVLDGLEFS